MGETPRIDKAKAEAIVVKGLLELLATWRKVVGLVAEAAKQLYPGARVYVAGGAAEGRLTAVSDIDVVVVLPRDPEPRERLEAKKRIMLRAFDMGVPLDYPLDLHVVGPRGLEKYRRLGRLVPLDP